MRDLQPRPTGRLTALGLIATGGVILGGIGVGGYPSGQADEDISRIGLNAMNL